MATPKPKAPSGHVPFHVPPVNQGQIVETAFGCDDEGALWARTLDRSVGETTFRYLGRAEDNVDGWEPWNEVPPLAIRVFANDAE